MSIIPSLNPYAFAAGGIAIALVVGGFVYEDHMIHHWHTQYDQLKQNDDKVIQNKTDTINNMIAAQKDQSAKVQPVVTKVVAIPNPIKAVVEEIHDAPEPANCKTPTLSEDMKNAF